jgi:hypothetical protein
MKWKTHYQKDQGAYPSIFISMRELSTETFDSFYTNFKAMIQDLFSKYEYLLETVLNENTISANLRKKHFTDLV